MAPSNACYFLPPPPSCSQILDSTGGLHLTLQVEPTVSLLSVHNGAGYLATDGLSMKSNGLKSQLLKLYYQPLIVHNIQFYRITAAIGCGGLNVNSPQRLIGVKTQLFFKGLGDVILLEKVCHAIPD